ncbi:MAG: DHA2 family efflux MFS transporter permease subunit [Candidatus Dormibacteraeota bacterium]|nr:DHA2 family efflux MFS transporter permease subunit [Candidatus Dormibacteraeota bacterium]
MRAFGAGGERMSRLRGNPWAILVVLCLGFFMVLLDITIVNIAIPSMIDGLQAGLDQILWVLNAYTLTYAVLLITTGRLGDRFGQRNLFVIGLVVFTVASAICGLAQNPDQLIASRVAQGIGGALLTPQTLAILTTIFPAERRGVAFGVWGGIAGIATITGPTLGGALVTYLSWRWIFYVNVPIGVAAVALALYIIPDLRPGRRTRIDPIGVLLASAGLFLITFGLIEGQRYNWSNFHTWGWLTISIPEIIGGGVLLMAAFFAYDFFQTTPLVPLSLFRDVNYAVMSWVSAALSFGMIGLFLPLTIYLQSALGFSAIKAGLTLVPMSLVSMFLAPVAGRIADRFPGQLIVAGGLLLFALGMGYIDLVAAPDSTFWTFLPGTLLAGIGLGGTFAPLATVGLRNVRPRMAGAASGVLNTVRQLGGAVGSAVVGAVLQNQLATHLHQEAVKSAAQLPPAFQQRFVDAFSQAAAGGLSVGRGQTGANLPAGQVPPQVASQIARLAHDTFTNAFIGAMRPTLLVPVILLLVGAVSCLAIPVRRRSQRSPAEARPVTDARTAA